MRYLYSLCIILLIVVSSSCRKDFSTVASSGNLTFSRDTVYLDTVFTNIGSATYNLKVYNKSNKAITIPQITLKNGLTSSYRLNVDGQAGKEFSNVDILANDSIYVFIETTIDYNTVTDPLYTDQILFDTGANQQDVDLVTLVKDANFIYPSKTGMGIETLTIDGEETEIEGRFLEDSELNFTNEKPYVIYGYAAVAANKTLTIEAGTDIHFHRNSGLIIDKEASLKAIGTLDEKITFQGDRLEHRFSNTPGQWGTIWMRAESKDNELNHVIIKNGVIGAIVDGGGDSVEPILSINNTEIYNNSNYGVLGRETHITGENLVIGSTGQSALAATVGGRYEFTHCTFANYWNNSLRDLPGVLVNNFFTYTDDIGNDVIETRNLHAANFTNCIFTGNNNIEFVLDKVDGGGIFNYMIKNSMIQFNDFNGSFAGNQQLDFDDTSHYENIILNGRNHFRDTNKNDFIIGEESEAINKAAPTTITLDILGVSRVTNPDIGAYQHITFDDE